ncbi:MAG: PorP/SprF family type IX secretion system membrane protein [Prevotellaceae bacterium]|jgi:type IX secretion system PorP/SprF family membrane protein|nr:PorP/SprF family type IX secretion system membrane protein [Prevotellaceae bacterium]
MIRQLIFILTLTLFAAEYSVAQSDFDLSQRHLNESVYNPAATGNTFYTNIYAHARVQWAGLPGAPYTEAIGFSTYLDDYNSAAALFISGDQIGFTHTYNARLSYAFYIPVFKRSAISLGLSGALLYRSQNATNALVDDLTDSELFHGNISETRPDFDFGVELNGPLKMGIAFRHFAPKLASANFKPYSSHIWSYISTTQNFGSSTTAIEPVVSHVLRDRFNRFEAGAFLHFKRELLRYNSYSKIKIYSDSKYWFGGMWRLHGQFSVMAGIALNENRNLKIGYSFDYAAGELARLSQFGTHEIFISWKMKPLRKCDSGCPGAENKELMDRVSGRFVIY